VSATLVCITSDGSFEVLSGLVVDPCKRYIIMYASPPTPPPSPLPPAPLSRFGKFTASLLHNSAHGTLERRNKRRRRRSVALKLLQIM
jgi:hypothetical protein